MLTFKQFLIENWRVTRLGVSHDAEVRGARVKVWAIEDSGRPPGHYSIGFETNGRDHSDDIELHGTAGHQILHHVASTLKSFVQKHQPKSIYFTANEGKKKRAYHAFAATLAKHLGGKHEPNYDYGHRIKFGED